ncbi:MAG: hypothetical protein QOK17_969 [Sphingomonadales bacterium]|jgi:hypothetical protein|nr:hypothetical protein [Sphingomonadales bacterium]
MRGVRLAALLLAPLPVAAAAAETPDPSDTYTLYWTIGESPVRQGDFWAKKQDMILDTRLWPVALYVADAAVSDAGGALLIPAGAQLIRLTSDRFVACTQVKAGAGLAKSKRVCLVDQDDDGKPDHSFSHGLGGLDWVAFEGRFSKTDLAPVQPMKLRELPPTQMAEAPYISFHYQRILDGGLVLPLTQEGGHQVRFHFKVGRNPDERRTWVTRECRDPSLPSFCASAAFPSKMTIAGLELDLLERRGEDIRMRMVQPFHGQQVRFQDTSYSYYVQLTMFSAPPQ